MLAVTSRCIPRGGVFLFSADTVREAMEELEEEARAA